MKTKHLFPSLILAAVLGSLATTTLAGAGPVYNTSDKYLPAEDPIRVVDRLPLEAGVPVEIDIPRLPHVLIGSNGTVYTNTNTAAAAASVNLTVVDPDGAGYLTAWDPDRPQPTVSNVNFDVGTGVLSNFATVRLSSRETLTLVSSVDTLVVVDLFGTFDSGASLYIVP